MAKYQVKGAEQFRGRSSPPGAEFKGLDESIDVLANNAEAIVRDIGGILASAVTLNSFGHEIARLDRDFDNPVTVAAFETEGALKFANQVQRQTLLRQLRSTDNPSGIQFTKPPSGSAMEK